MRLYAYAKINLTLDIIGRRTDGYHIIDSVFQSIGIFDVIEVKKADRISVFCGEISGKSNIAFSAAKNFFDFTGIPGGADISIQKGIPFLSGLGGGSADAAAVIIALDRIYGTSLSKNKMSKIALCCGADVPFFILGGGTARVGGIGEKVTSIADIAGYYAVLLKSGEKKSTADMYARLDNMPPAEPVTGEFMRHAEKGNYRAALESAGNAFLAAGADENTFSALKAQEPICVSLSGSGPTHFAVFDSAPAANAAADKLKKYGFTPIVAPFVNCAVSVIE